MGLGLPCTPDYFLKLLENIKVLFRPPFSGGLVPEYVSRQTQSGVEIVRSLFCHK